MRSPFDPGTSRTCERYYHMTRVVMMCKVVHGVATKLVHASADDRDT